MLHWMEGTYPCSNHDPQIAHAFEHQRCPSFRICCNWHVNEAYSGLSPWTVFKHSAIFCFPQFPFSAHNWSIDATFDHWLSASLPSWLSQHQPETEISSRFNCSIWKWSCVIIMYYTIKQFEVTKLDNVNVGYLLQISPSQDLTHLTLSTR